MVHFFIIVTVVTAAALFIGAMAWALKVLTGGKRYETPQEKSTNEQYNGRIPRAGNHYLLAIALFILIAMVGCSPTAFRANGCPYKEYNNKPFKA